MKVHLIGIGGIGMSALARVLLQRGIAVRGSDAQESSLLAALRQEGAEIAIGHRASSVEEGWTVAYSSAVKGDNAEWRRAKQLGLPLLHRSDLLERLMRGQQPLLVTGTHGKTTTTTLLASVLREAGGDPSFVLGGIHRAWNTNGGHGTGPFFVAEADESDGSFLKGRPHGAIVTNLEDEHLDYWKTSDALDRGFSQFLEQTLEPASLFWCGDDPRLRRLAKRGVSYGFGAESELRIAQWRADPAGVLFSLEWRGVLYQNIRLALYGRHNVLNGAAVFGLALSLRIAEEAIRRAFHAFAGVERRLDLRGEANGVLFYDDYGHHPTEIAATLEALRLHIGSRRLIAVFQPHRYTRVRDLFHAFVSSFQEADLVVMTDIYSAGEAPLPGFGSAELFAALQQRLGKKALFAPRAAAEDTVRSLLTNGDVVLTLGAGDVTKMRWGGL